MRRVLLLACGVLLASVCSAQQPDIRVRILSLYSLPQITIVPGSEARVKWGEESPQALRAPILLQARGNLVASGARRGSQIVVSGEFQIASAARTLTIRVPVEVSAREGRLQIIARYPVEEYVAAVLQGETAGDMPPEALKAMAVAIRSYATRFRERHKSEGFDFCDTTHCQYLRPEVTAAVRGAVQQTSGELLWEKGVPLAAYYHKDCGGQTEAAAAVWGDQRSEALVSRRDPYCVRASSSWHAEISRADIERALAVAGLATSRGWDRIIISERTPTGRARMLRLGNMPLSASSFRFAIGRSLGWNTLKSDWYDVAGNGERFVFTGKGVGHGVGLCQTGAAEMAKQGKTYREILAFYYVGSLVGRSAQGIPWQRAPGEAFDVLVVNAADTASVNVAASRALSSALQASGLTARVHPVIEVYPSVSMFRDATGEAGWVAASTRGNRIRLQPPNVLGNRLESVLRHEFLHLIVESNAHANTPLWFREGLVVFLAGGTAQGSRVRLSPEQIEETIRSRRSQAEVESAYAGAAALVGDLERQWGRAVLLRWLREGLPSGILSRSAAARSDKEP